MTGIRRQENLLNGIGSRSSWPYSSSLLSARLKTTKLLYPRLYPPPHMMSEDHASKRRKASRSAITSTAPAKQLVRPRPGSPARESEDDIRPAKRTRKAINCEPCRSSKLKCNRSVRIRPSGPFLILLYRARPVCSSCACRSESLDAVGSMMLTGESLRLRHNLQTRLRCATIKA